MRSLLVTLFLLACVNLIVHGTPREVAPKDSIIEQRTVGAFKVTASVQTNKTNPGKTYVIRIRDNAGKLVDSLAILKLQEYRHQCGGHVSFETVLTFVDDFHIGFAAKYALVDCSGYVTYYGWDDKRNRQILMYMEGDIRGSLAKVSKREGVLKYKITDKGKFELEPGSELKEVSFLWIGLDILRLVPKERIILYQNWILATYGYKFPDALTLAHFAQKDWYKGTIDNIADLKINSHDQMLLDHLSKVAEKRPSAEDTKVSTPASLAYTLVTKAVSKKFDSHMIYSVNSSGKVVDSIGYAEHEEYPRPCGNGNTKRTSRLLANDYFVIDEETFLFKCPIEKNPQETESQFRARLLKTDDPTAIVGYKQEWTNTRKYIVKDDGDIVNSGTEFKSKSVELVGKELLNGIPKDRLRLMRNQVFAANGYIFKDPALFTYYLQRGGYIPVYDDPSSFLAATEAAIVTCLKKLEDGMK